jgi:toxin ParE1/3/4
VSRLKLRISLLADADVLGHYCCVGRERPTAAERFLDALESGYERITEHPRIGVACTELAPTLEELRRWPVPGFASYLIFYRPAGETIEIVRVLHGARDLEGCLAAPITFDRNPDA